MTASEREEVLRIRIRKLEAHINSAKIAAGACYYTASSPERKAFVKGELNAYRLALGMFKTVLRMEDLY